MRAATRHQQLHVGSGNSSVESTGYDDHVDIAPLVGSAVGIRSEQDSPAHFERVLPSQHVHVAPDRAYHDCISHWGTSLASPIRNRA